MYGLSRNLPAFSGDHCSRDFHGAQAGLVLKHALDTEGGEPSKYYLATVKVLGTAMIIIPAVVILVSILSLILAAVGLG